MIEYDRTRLENEVKEATEAMERIHARGPFGAAFEDSTSDLAHDVAIVMHFLKTTMPRFINDHNHQPPQADTEGLK